MSKDPLITVGIACFNAEQTIERAINSSLAQTWGQIEILIVDDCSTDNSLINIYRLANDEPRIRVLKNNVNCGIAKVRNQILENSKGDFIAFFDDDDESLPERLEQQYQRIIKYEEVTGENMVICHSGRTQIFPDGLMRYEATIGISPDGIAPNSKAMVERTLIGRSIGEQPGSCAACSQMARLQTYKTLNCFNEEFRRSEDTEFSVRLALAGGHFVGISAPLVNQYMYKNNGKSIETERKYAKLLLDKNREYLLSTGWYDHAVKWMDIKFDYLAGNRRLFFTRLMVLLLKSPVKTAQRFTWAWANRKNLKHQASWYLGSENINDSGKL